MEPHFRTACRDCPGRIVCHCLQVTEEAVAAAVVALGIRSVKELKTATGAGDGCTCCHRQLTQLIARHAQSSSSAEPICS